MTDEEFLDRAFMGNRHAADFVLMLARISHVWDDLIDRDKPVSNETINRTFFDALIELPANPFYREHYATLRPLMAIGAMNYEIANTYEALGGEERLALAHVLRYSIADIATAVALITGGPDWARKIGPELRQRSQKDTLQHYLKEHGNDLHQA
jgi:hypothetical protein